MSAATADATITSPLRGRWRCGTKQIADVCVTQEDKTPQEYKHHIFTLNPKKGNSLTPRSD